MREIQTKEGLMDRTINDLKEIPENLRRDYVIALLTCVALETGEDLCDSLRLLHRAMAEIDSLFGHECPCTAHISYEGLAN